MPCSRGRLEGADSLCVRMWEVRHGLWSEASVLRASKARNSSGSYKEVGQGDTPGASRILRIELTSALCPQSFTYLLEFFPNLVGLCLVFPRRPVSHRLLGVSDDAECIPDSDLVSLLHASAMCFALWEHTG